MPKQVDGFKICSNKECDLAGIWQPVSNFSKNYKNADKLSNRCKACNIRGCLEYYENNKERFIKYGERRAGLRDGERDLIRKRQNNRCLCCEDEFNNSRSIHLHRDHRNNKIIGLLCRDCNLAEGLIKTPDRAYKLWKMMKENK